MYDHGLLRAICFVLSKKKKKLTIYGLLYELNTSKTNSKAMNEMQLQRTYVEAFILFVLVRFHYTHNVIYKEF